jgi:hypothetical protein
MARDPRDESLRKHKEWLGYLQPVGLVVSPPALADADCHVNMDVAGEFQRFVAGTEAKRLPDSGDSVGVVKDLKSTLLDVFGWQATDLVPADDSRAADLVVPLREYGETIRPTYAVLEDPKAQPPTWAMLVQEIPLGQPFDVVAEGDSRKWQATPQARFERLLRESGVSAGLLSNGVELRLAYAPRGESPGHVTFPVPVMLETAGRPVFAALLMLLRESRVFGSTGGATLNDILAASRKYQNTVSTELARQVLAALYELLRGFQAADVQRKGELLADVLSKAPDQVYAGQLTVLLRLVFLLYAEDRGLMSDSEVYVRHYSVTGLFEKLREDSGRHPDTMDQRYGAWARLVTVFRMVHDGAQGSGIKLPARHGYLFDPDRYPFLEGRKFGSQRVPGERIAPPLVSDGVVFRVLRNLMILDGERLSYRALDVEQIGSVYEAMMGFRVEVAYGRSIAVRPKKPHGAPVTINLEALLAEGGEKRGKWFQDAADLKLTPKEVAALKAAKTPEDAVAALDRKVAKEVTPNIVPAGSMVLQPSDERRRSGSHYTPRSLTEPIVRNALEPVLKQLGDNPTPTQILDLKVCDPAMGSGAFLVEACRQLGEVLVKAWNTHLCLPKIPPDEDDLLHAQRLVAQRCLYGVDKNPMAVDLAKLSLWLATLAKNHPFTFIDHALRCGDSLVGLTREQIAEFHWKDCPQRVIGQDVIEDRIKAATASRNAILDADEYTPRELKEQKLKNADEALNLVRFTGNLVVSAFFAADSDKKRQQKRDDYLGMLSEHLRSGKPDLRPTKQERALREGEKPIEPFHWEIEFPEVFGRNEVGFDVIVGNPPFLGGTLIGGRLGLAYHDYLIETYNPATGLADVIAFFMRRSFALLRRGGAFGLIATNTVAQGDTRSAGLEQIVLNGGSIYRAQRRYEWPGEAAVVASLLHVTKGQRPIEPSLDGVQVRRISAFLLKGDADTTPANLSENKGVAFRGTKVWGAGFVFEDNPSNGSSSLSDMEQLIADNPRNREVIFAYMGGEEFNSSPTQSSRRFVIDFGVRSESDSRQWSALFSIVEERVRPVRAGNKQRNYRENWWLHANRVDEAGPYLARHGRVLALTCVSKHISVAFAPSGTIIADSMLLLLLHEDGDFAVIQSRIHEVWARLIGSSMKDDLRYTTPCFDTFPRPVALERAAINETGRQYYEFRAQLMKKNEEGLTATNNRFHDPTERNTEIVRLRELHDAMDRAVLAAYGPPFSELTVPPCEFLLDYQDEDDEEETGKRQKKKPWRYRWPDAFRDEVLALLLELNKERADAEKIVTATPAKPKKGAGRKATATADDSQQPGLF